MPLFAFLLLAAAQLIPPAEIHVDEQCRIVTQDRKDAAHRYNKPRLREDPAICHLESEHNTHHWEGTVVNGVVMRTRVKIIEREYVLHNLTDQPIAFIVDQTLPDGWIIDSVPQPVEIADNIATFRVIAQPGEVIHLHVGERH